ncbi:MAG: hypothetical protein ACOX88_10365 [Christensenellales bacterium]|jgi:stage V sporulation protein AA
MSETAQNRIYFWMEAETYCDNLEAARLGDIVHFWPENETAKRLAKISLGLENNPVRMMRFTQLDAVSAILEKHPQLEVKAMGEEACWVCERQQKPEDEKKKKLLSMVKIAAVALIFFFGSAMTMINFHADVDMTTVHQILYTFITGETAARPLWVAIPYSIGVGIGTFIFVGRKMWNKQVVAPNPLELQDQAYRQDMQRYLQKQMLNDEEAGP